HGWPLRSGRGSAPARAPDMRNQQHQSRRRHPVDSPRMANGAGPMHRQLLQEFVRETRQPVIIELVRQFAALVASVRGDVSVLASEIDRVFSVDFELVGDLALKSAELRPDSSEFSHSEVRIRQQFEGRSALAVAIEQNAVSFGLVWRDGQRIGERLRRAQGGSFDLELSLAAGADAAQSEALPGPALVAGACAT